MKQMKKMLCLALPGYEPVSAGRLLRAAAALLPSASAPHPPPALPPRRLTTGEWPASSTIITGRLPSL